MRKLSYITTRGKAPGTQLQAHRHADGMYVASKTRFKADYIRVHDETELIALVQQGYKVRMSNPDCLVHRAPSLVIPQIIET